MKIHYTLESQLGRVRSADRYAPRPIDLDIIVWNDEIIDEDVHERDFLSRSIQEVLPNLPVERVNPGPADTDDDR